MILDVAWKHSYRYDGVLEKCVPFQKYCVKNHYEDHFPYEIVCASTLKSWAQKCIAMPLTNFEGHPPRFFELKLYIQCRFHETNNTIQPGAGGCTFKSWYESEYEPSEAAKAECSQHISIPFLPGPGESEQSKMIHRIPKWFVKSSMVSFLGNRFL